MKTIITTTLNLLSQFMFAQTKVSVSDGNWNDPQNWSPAVVPFLGEDSVIIEHEIQTSGDHEVGINQLIIKPTGKLANTGAFALHGSLRNEGDITSDTLLIGDGYYFINYGTIFANQLAPANPLNENYGQLDLLGSLACPEPFTNMTTGTIETEELITSSDADFENNGSHITVNWINEGTVFGTGSFCIEECFKNVGTITGTLDICDLTPTTDFTCDFNFGTLGPNVTMCTSSVCTGTSGITDSVNDIALEIYPNPSNGIVSIETDQTIESFELYDIHGRLLLENEVINNSLDLSFLQNGQYVIILLTNDQHYAKRITILQ